MMLPYQKLSRRQFVQTTLLTGAAWLMTDPLSADNEIAAGPELLSPSGLETLFLTWAGDPLTTMRIQWIVANQQTPSPIRISFRTKVEGEKKNVSSVLKPFGKTLHWVHRVDLSALQPGTLYQFCVGDHPEIFYFETAPLILNKPLVFAEGGDIGTDPTRVVPLHQMAAGWDPLFGLVVGDHAYSNGQDVSAELKYLKLWRANMLTSTNRLIPLVAGIGNHEVIGGFHKKPVDAPYFYSLFDGLFQEEGAYGTLDFGTYLSLILLDSGHTCEVETQVNWLKQALNARKTARHCFVGYHVPAYPSVRKFEDEISTQIRKHWIPLIEASTVRTVFEHHDHAFKRTVPLLGGKEDPKGITYLGDGAWGREPREIHSKEAAPYLAKSRSSMNVWKVAITSTGSQFMAMNEKRETLDSIDRRP